jgi:pimeloyl-ACP methyl ester carboxylesterase
VPVFDDSGITLHYSERGDAEGPAFVMLHGLLWSSRMLRRIAGRLPHHRILLLDLRGHGPSSRPTDPEAYSWSSLAGDVVALLDHLDIDRAVVGGLSLGANVTLAMAHEHPERVAAMVPEMPVLDRAEGFARPVFGAVATTLAYTAPALGPLGAAVDHFPLPGSVPELAAVRDVFAAEPRSGAALLRGLLDDDLTFEQLDVAAMTMPTLVIGHRWDPLHVLEDAQQLVDELPDARLEQRWTMLDFRLRPDLLADLLTRFLRDVQR